MKQVTTILGELLKIFPRYEFEKLEKQYQSNHYTKYFTGWQQLITLQYAQIVGHDSLRAIQTSLGVHYQKWYHLGLDGIKRSTLSDAMKNRPYKSMRDCSTNYSTSVGQSLLAINFGSRIRSFQWMPPSLICV